PCVGVLYGKTTVKQELIDHKAAAIVDSVQELHRVLLGT
ncbi:MAG: haloacid dehalogenase, partial [Lancefieldella rimae]|nr:haloacid dehalogenase [Lancefieldella rimae]